ncbi:MAG TPA: hypothetical protein VNA30_03960 [Mycobacteriales bacterium]|nr:hypothetical protein [Mycobacteriales bacterium]
MTPIRTLAVLSGLALTSMAAASHADGVSDAAVTSFTIGNGGALRGVEIVASRGSAGDVLLVSIEDCRRSNCTRSRRSLALPKGHLDLTAERAELRTTVDGRRLKITWKLTGDGITAHSGRLHSAGNDDATTFDAAAGRTAAVTVVLDGTACASTGSIGHSVQVQQGAAGKAGSLGAGTQLCE